jgi:predicted enzyme related to lactoylglutathione lyase
VRHFELYGPNTSELQRFYADAFGWEMIEVDDLQAALESVESLGGKTVTPITEVPGLVTFAEFQDPQGNVIGLALP